MHGLGIEVHIQITFSGVCEVDPSICCSGKFQLKEVVDGLVRLTCKEACFVRLINF